MVLRRRGEAAEAKSRLHLEPSSAVTVVATTLVTVWITVLASIVAGLVASMGLRRTATAVVGFAVLLLGVALLVVPIPGTSLLVFPLGLAILAREFAWARRLRDRSTGIARRTCGRISTHVRSLLGARPLKRAAVHPA